MSIGNKIKNARLEKNMSQSELAHILNITPAQLSFYENNKSALTITTLKEISMILEKPISYFIEEEPDTKTKEIIKNMNNAINHQKETINILEKLLNDLPQHVKAETDITIVADSRKRVSKEKYRKTELK